MELGFDVTQTFTWGSQVKFFEKISILRKFDYYTIIYIWSNKEKTRFHNDDLSRS